jgi:quinol monooxygenase YgiN
MAIVRINEFHAAPDKAAALREFLGSVIDVIKTSPGCQACELLAQQDDPARLVIVETWDSVAAHQAAATRIPPEKLAEVRPLLAEPPVGRYHDRLR